MLDSTIDEILKEYERWKSETSGDVMSNLELSSMADNERELIDAFYKEILFGTSGLRGIMGIGPNRMNHYVISRATRGLSAYLNKTIIDRTPTVIVSYDTRHNSEAFAQTTCQVFDEEGIDVQLFQEPTAVPILSYAIRELKCDMGIMITASHNPKIYNGYKVYNNDGFQIVGEEADKIMDEISKLDYFNLPEIKAHPKFVDSEIVDDFIKSTLDFFAKNSKAENEDLKIIYTPLNGTGRNPVLACLKARGFKRITVVKSQEMPDGNFPTCPVPNPEKIAAYNEAFFTLDREKGDIVIATDPDCDRVGVALYFDGVKKILTGNQIGVLLFDYLCRQKKQDGNIVMRSIVSTSLIDKIADKNGIHVMKTLTGFKHMGKLMTQLETEGQLDKFLFAFEESNGFLFNKNLRDKDGVGGVLLICEMAAYYKHNHTTLHQRLEEIYDEFGDYHDKTKSFVFEGSEGRDTMDGIMSYFRTHIKGFLGGIEVLEKIDYLNNEDHLRENIIEFRLRDHGTFIIRPSGTEPKIKVYFFGNRDTRHLETEIGEIIGKFTKK